ncbi:oligosaccharide flippase family protein [Sphingomonas sp. 3-13AW]|uniref:oligosaccharide flippase family protein n=1 Tax=Sphingomonas sp. 3-13AW TaxID=3050450 RepID=UPI003BB4CF91
MAQTEGVTAPGPSVPPEATTRPKNGSGLQSVRWTAVGNLLRTMLATLQLLIIARLVTVPEFGLAVLVSSLLLVAQQISDAGLSTALIRFRDVTDAEMSSLYWLNAFTGLVLAAATVVAAPALARAFAAPDLGGMLCLVAVVFVAQGLFLQLRVLAERDLRFGDVVKVETSATAIGFVVAVALAFRGHGAYSVVWGQVASALTQLGLSWTILARVWKPRLHFRVSEVARFVPYGLDILLVNIVTALTVQIDILVAGLYFPKQAFGSFAQPRDLSLRVMTAINPVITRVGLPVIARHQNEPALAGTVYLRMVRMSATVCFPVYGALALLGPDLLPAVLGAKWAAAGALMPFIAAWFVVRCLVNPLGSYMNAMGRSRHAFYYQTAFAGLVTVGAFAGARVGPITLALTMAGVYLVFVEVSWAAVLRPISGVGFLDYHRQFCLPLAATLVACGCVVGVRATLGPGWGVLAVALAAGGPAFVGASLLLNRAGVTEIRRLIGLVPRTAGSERC